MKLKAIDLFSGCGGLTQGLRDAGFDVIGAIEFESIAAETYRENHKKTFLWEKDITEVTGEEILNQLGLKKGELDLLAGCPPCQGFSSIGTLNGKKSSEDPRNELIFQFLRLIEELQPKAIMMENVPALIKDIRMDLFKKKIKELGYRYGNFPTVMNAADFGVPQRRKRMILMASRYGAIPLVESKKQKITVRQAIGHLPVPEKSSDRLHNYPENRTEKVMNIIRKIPSDGGSRRNMGQEFQLECHKKCKGGFKDVYGRMKWNDVSPTMTGGCTNPSKGRFLHPEQHRAITLREAALLQTFPPNYYFSLRGGKGRVSLMIGNALPPVFIKHHALTIKKALQNN